MFTRIRLLLAGVILILIALLAVNLFSTPLWSHSLVFFGMAAVGHSITQDDSSRIFGPATRTERVLGRVIVVIGVLAGVGVLATRVFAL